MGLLGTPLLVLLVVAALTAPAGVAFAWSRVRGPRLVRVGSRLALVATAQVAALAVGLVALNDYGQFFTSWSELLGTGPAASVVNQQHFGAAPTTTPTARHALRGRTPTFAHVAVTGTALPAGTRATSWSARSQWATRGAVLEMNVPGSTTGLTEQALVYLPPAYFAGVRAMPVVEVMTGYPGSTLLLVDRLHYPSYLLAAMDAGTRPMVLVLLRPSVTYPRDTECTDVPNGPQAFSYFANDVPSVVASTFALRPTSYGAIGDSTGAMCAVKLAVTDPQRFVAAVSLSGYFRAVRDITTGDLYGGSTTVRHRNDIMWRLQHLPLPPVSLLVATSLTERGADGYRSAQKLLALVHAPMSADEIVLSHGGHNFETWTQEIPPALRWLGSHLP
jgi:S-formylglutathione hydrolase FrmB